MLRAFSNAILTIAVLEGLPHGCCWAKDSPFETTTHDYWNDRFETPPDYWNDIYGHGSTTETSTKTTFGLRPIATKSEFAVTATAVPKNETSFAHLNSLYHVNLYRYYGLENKEYNLKFLFDAFEKLETDPDVHKSADGKWLACKIPFLSGAYYRGEHLRSVARDALVSAKGTAIEDIVTFIVAHTLQFNAIMYLKIIVIQDFFLSSHAAGECLNKDVMIFKRRLERNELLLRESLSKGEVPIDERGQHGAADEISLHERGVQITRTGKTLRRPLDQKTPV
ncbi:unnamed protein product [Cylicocyclus nassatus]|uniref:Uncharacterized protein n=1 Tax=Cylicocyclus nassatus TaxID=53992 RepID=A0AA36MEL1_CYLNA|nr:unnamed protein product [Cylicocyclus nassatus]